MPMGQRQLKDWAVIAGGSGRSLLLKVYNAEDAFVGEFNVTVPESATMLPECVWDGAGWDASYKSARVDTVTGGTVFAAQVANSDPTPLTVSTGDAVSAGTDFGNVPVKSASDTVAVTGDVASNTELPEAVASANDLTATAPAVHAFMFERDTVSGNWDMVVKQFAPSASNAQDFSESTMNSAQTLTIPAGTRSILIGVVAVVASSIVTWTLDGDTPSATLGMPLKEGVYEFQNVMSTFKMINVTSGGCRTRAEYLVNAS